MRQQLIASASRGPAWLFDLLYAHPGLVTWAPAGQLPGGYQRADQFAITPAGPDRSFCVSLSARRGAAAAVTAYNGLRPPRRRLARGALGLGLRAGLAQHLLATKVDVGTAAGATSRQLAEASLTWYLRDLFGGQPITVAFGCGSGPYRKPVLQVFSAGGAPLGYVKVGWNDWTRDAVRREADALLACAAAPQRLGAPGLLHAGPWRDLELLVTAPLPRRVRRVGPDSPADQDLLAGICALGPRRSDQLSGSPWWAQLNARITGAVTDPAARLRLSLLADQVADRIGHVRLEFGRWHGDLVPWNLARHGGRLYAWDWESSSPDAPVGFDPLHYYFQVAFIARRQPLAEAAAFAARAAGPALSALNVADSARPLLPPLHLLDLAVRHEEARASTGDADERFSPAILHTLDAAVAGLSVPAAVTGGAAAA